MKKIINNTELEIKAVFKGVPYSIEPKGFLIENDEVIDFLKNTFGFLSVEPINEVKEIIKEDTVEDIIVKEQEKQEDVVEEPKEVDIEEPIEIEEDIVEEVIDEVKKPKKSTKKSK